MENKNEFVAYLEGLTEDRGKLAALRRGLGLPPGTCVAMYPIVAIRLPRNIPKYEEERYYLIASLFGLHPSSSETGNMGDHMRHACSENLVQAVERRFAKLLAANWEDLSNELRQTISYLKSKGIPVNWHQLIADLKNWSHPDRFVQRKWASAFWGYISTENPKE